MRPLASEDARDQIRSRLNLVDVVQQHVRLRKQGREHWGLCPFHPEKTPSFHVTEQKQSWWCFSCQKGGDMFAFVQEVEKVDFPGALRILAEMAGVELPERSGPAQQRAQLRRRLLDLNRLAAQYYEYVLHTMPAGEPGRQLLVKREVGEETARRFGLGYAPGGGNFSAFLRKRGHSIPDAIEAGLVRRTGQDYFQDRLVVPIRDERGQVLAFTGRTVMDGEPRKYVNSPETPAYSKGRVLFALDLARTEIQERGHAVLMEGQFDVIVGHQFGVGNAIASSGTALTSDQLALLRRFSDEVVLMFDNDRAGRAAAAKAVELAQEHQVRTRVARIQGEAKDPDEFLRGGGRWDEVLGAARPGWEALVRDAIEGLNARSPADREVGIRRIREVLAQIRDPAERDTYAEVAGRLFDIESRLLLAFGPTPARRPATAQPDVGPGPTRDGLVPPAAGNKLSNGVGYLLSVLAVRPEAVERVLGILDPADLEEDDREAYLRVVSAIERGGREGLGDELEQLTAEEQGLVRRAWAAPPPSVQDEVVDEVVRRIREQARRRQRRALIDSLSEAERRGDRAQVEALQVQLNEIRERS
ncbi:MAG TPA: DNA primase [Candidatus Dormibacteraeota bacterium]|jgi:DNA primase